MEPLNFHCDQSIITNLLHLAENMKSCPLLDAIFPHLTGLMMSQYPELFDPMAFHHRESFFET